MFSGGAISDLRRGSGTGVPAVHVNGIIPVQAEVLYSSALSTAKPVRTFAAASTGGTASTRVPLGSCDVGGRTLAHRPRITYSTKSRIAASFAASPSTTSALPTTTTDR